MKMAYVSESRVRAPISKSARHRTARSSSISRSKTQDAEPRHRHRRQQSVRANSIPRGDQLSGGGNQQHGTSHRNPEYEGDIRRRSPGIGSERSPIDRTKRTQSENPRKGGTTKSAVSRRAAYSTAGDLVHGRDSTERASRQRSSGIGDFKEYEYLFYQRLASH